jgi:glutamate racemase
LQAQFKLALASKNSRKNQHPIGIFDSGIGGLTVANAICKLLPNESIIYFGDTAHLPYGDKSPESIRHYSAKITHYLTEQNCKAIVIACNTASALGFQTAKDIAGSSIPVINVVDPAVAYLSQHFKGKRVGIIGTKGTVNSRIYVNKLAKADKTIDVAQLATPLLAPMIEEGFFNNKISKTIINSYLEKKPLANIQALVLGCTHYPLIKPEIDSFYKKKVQVLDTSEIVAKAVAETLKEKGLLNENLSLGTKEFCVSDFTKGFEESARYFFDEKINLKEIRLWKDE